jgi:hypothetical protein
MAAAETVTQAIHDYLDIVIAVLSIGAVMVTVFVWANRRFTRKILDVISTSTANIKTDANGGQSLNDVNVRVTEVASALFEHVERQQEVEHKRDLQYQKIEYELALIKRIASYPAEGEE